MRIAVSIAVVLLLPIASQAASGGTGGDAVVYPDVCGAIISDWGYDIKQPKKAELLTPQLAHDLFVTDQLTCLRVAIYGDKVAPAHPGPGVVATAEKAMAGVFDCIDAGMTGFVWWSYRREEADLKSSLIHRLALSTLGSRPIDVDDVDGRGMKAPGQLITRGFRKGQNVAPWVINNNASTSYTPYKFKLATQAIAGEVVYTQWTATASTTGAATRLSDTAFAVNIPVKTVTEITFSPAPQGDPQ